MKTGMASACAKLNGPPCTAAAEATTRFPVTWAVKIWPSVRKPVRSTIPAMTLSNGGRRASKRDNATASSRGSAHLRSAAELLAGVDMFPGSHDFCSGRSVAQIVNDHLRYDEA